MYGGNGGCWNWSSDVDATFAQYEGVYDQWQTAQDAQHAAYIAAWNQASADARAAAFYQAAQQVIIAGIQAAAAQYAADRQFDIADRQMNIAEAEFERYQEHFVCVENKLADEACEEEKYEPDYDTKSARAIVDVRKQFDLARKRLTRLRSRWCLDDFSKDLCDLETREAQAIAAAKDAAYRHEEAYAQAQCDARFNRATQVSNIGRGIQATGISTFAQGANNALGAVQTQLNGFNNVLGALSGGLSGIIQTQFAPSVNTIPSPYTNAYSTYTPQAIGGGGYGGAYAGLGGLQPAPVGGTGGLY